MSELLLEITEGPGAGRQAPLVDPLEVGRDPSSGLVLEDDLVSGRHLTWYGPSLVEARDVLELR